MILLVRAIKLQLCLPVHCVLDDDDILPKTPFLMTLHSYLLRASTTDEASSQQVTNLLLDGFFGVFLNHSPRGPSLGHLRHVYIVLPSMMTLTSRLRYH